MSLSVTTANPGTISGVTTANPGTINGVVSAQPGTISSTSSAPNTGATNYNPQGSANSNIQPAATTAVVQPASTSGQNINQTPTDSSQTFKLGDGSVYNAAGQQVSGPTTSSGGTANGYTGYGGATVADQGPSINTQTPSTTTDSTSLTADTSYSDIQKVLNDNLAGLDKLFSNLSQYSTVGPEEQAQQQKVAGDQAAMTSLGYQAQGLYNPGNQTIALPFLTGQANGKLVGAGIQSTLDQSVLNYMQGNRQFAFNSASTIFNAAQQNLQTTLDAYTKMAPQNVSTNYNPTTGDVNAIMRNPLTGQTYTAPLGNIGAQKSFTSTNIATNPLTGELTFVGTTSDGQVVQQPISGTPGGGAQISNPLQGGSGSGNYTQTSAPQQATVGALLSNWTSGGTTSPGAGYQAAVYQTVSKLTGQTINANTPTSTLISNIPALSQGIAKAEGYGQANNVGTRINNPGNILWANQPNAVAYKASNGYTYAKFNTEQDGYNAMNNLIAKKLGAIQTPTLTPAQAVQNLPASLQGAVRKLADGTPYFDANQLTDAQIPMAQSYAYSTHIPYLNKADASKLGDISVTQANIKDFTDLVKNTLTNSSIPGAGVVSGIAGTFSGNYLGGETAKKFDSMRTIALNAIQGLAGGSGSGFRLNASEISTAVSNLPTIYDTQGQAMVKLNAINAQLNKWIAQAIPNWKPQELSTSSTPDYTATLNNLISAYNPQ